MKIFVTGGAGFIGCNLADHYSTQGHDVIVFDNLSRKGAEKNLEWLQSKHDSLVFIEGDVRDYEAICDALTVDVDQVFHMAGQVAVTTSVRDPRTDFQVNAVGTFNVLEAVRTRAPEALLFYASTNKVYGSMSEIEVVEKKTRYKYGDRPHGIAEDQSLDFHSPYGCSKGAGDQYVRDYARIYGLRTVVFRQSCIYGARQFGFEDQGWVAHFCIASRLKRPITIFGDGKQVRDVLWIEDLIRAYEAAADHARSAVGEIYNIGGGPNNTMSIWTEFGPLLEKLAGRSIPVTYAEQRPGDQAVFVSDIRKAKRELDWSPTVSVEEGVEKLWRWVDRHPDYF